MTSRRRFLKSGVGALAAPFILGQSASSATPHPDSEHAGLALGEAGPLFRADPDRSLDLTDEVSLEAWIRSEPMSESGGRILDKSVPGTSEAYGLDTYPGNSLRLITSKGACQADARLKADHWTHVIGVYSSRRRIMSLYLDGRPVASVTGGDFPPMSISRSPLCVGADPNGGNRFHGRILHAAIYRRALNPDEIARRANALSGRESAAPSGGLIAEWSFDHVPRRTIPPLDGALVLKDSAWAGVFEGEAPTPEQPFSLWYRRPAKTWLEALPIGNGRLGAMVFGGVDIERLQLNEGTLWAGGPHDYSNPDGLAALPEIRRLVFAGEWSQAQKLVDAHFMGRPAGQMPYQPVGNFTLNFEGGDVVSDYRRDLSLDDAIVRTSYVSGGVRFTREVFASAPDQVIVIRLAADRPGALTFTAGFDSPQTSTVRSTDSGTITLSGTAPEKQGIAGVTRFQAVARVRARGGSTAAHGETLRVEGSTSAVILISMATGYQSYRDAGGDPSARAAREVDIASLKDYERIRSDHTADYQRHYRRITLDLGSSASAKSPTDERLQLFKEGGDPQLPALHFQFGRYLLISCSRPGGQPATLQGLWNDSTDPPWGSKYTININTEMNYWPAGPANLLECYEPLFDMISQLPHPGSNTAKTQYGAGGWVCHHNTDGWRGTAPVDYSFSGMWPSGGAWLCKSYWDHYEFTRDRAALARHYPVMKGAAQFFLDALVEDPVHHWLVTNPSVSPEKEHHPGVSICAGPTMDMQILRDLFDACDQASTILGLDDEFRTEVRNASRRLAPMQIGREGQLQEWLEDWDGQAPDQHHRHVSHLYGLFPGAQITSRTPELLAAARKSLELRGDAGTGWSLAWKINLWARLGQGDHAFELISLLLTTERTAPNLFDLHPPFQIDGNFGAASGVVEMLLQSHEGNIHLLPALPAAWPSGSVVGLRARGGFEVDLQWRTGELTTVTVHSHAGELCVLRVGQKEIRFPTRAGEKYVRRLSDWR